MQITIRPKAEVTNNFVDLMIEIYETWLKGIMKTSRYGMKQGLGNVARTLPIVRRQNPDLHTGLDYEITRLRMTDYEKFYATTVNGTRYIVGQTRHITLTEPIMSRVGRRHVENGDRRLRGELGKYHIYLSTDLFARSDMGLLHMIPERNPRSVFRHPHHYLAEYSGRYYPGQNGVTPARPLPAGVSPLSAVTGNCWGTSSVPLKSNIEMPDIPALFLIMLQHARTYGNSPPIHMEQLDFDWHTNANGERVEIEANPR
jgi:hypothetical protein